MKKTIFAIVSSLVLMSCGGAETTEATQSDSAQVVDSSVTAQDTTTAEITEDGGGIQDGTEIK
jgi:hypothetical protein